MKGPGTTDEINGELAKGWTVDQWDNDHIRSYSHLR